MTKTKNTVVLGLLDGLGKNLVAGKDVFEKKKKEPERIMNPIKMNDEAKNGLQSQCFMRRVRMRDDDDGEERERRKIMRRRRRRRRTRRKSQEQRMS